MPRLRQLRATNGPARGGRPALGDIKRGDIGSTAEAYAGTSRSPMP
jgi:orotidine-5'-phosphate decarboxylase